MQQHGRAPVIAVVGGDDRRVRRRVRVDERVDDLCSKQRLIAHGHHRRLYLFVQRVQAGL